jgi:UDP-N-acetylmuramate--alanine ligase
MPEQPLSPDLRAPTSIHVVGVGGAGMSALAMVLAQMGHKVSGSDLRESKVLGQLRSAGVAVQLGHREDRGRAAQWVTSSPAVHEDNVELAGARARGQRIVSRATMLAALTRVTKTLAVAGTHGKTTTASMLTLILAQAGLKPSFLIGAPLSDLGVNARFEAGSPLVLEADESYGSFGELEPAMTGITNVDVDHLDYYGSLERLEVAFVGLCERTQGPVVVVADDPGAAKLGRRCHAITVGQDAACEVRIGDVDVERASSTFSLELPDASRLALRLAAPGLHNVRNAALAGTMASVAGVPGVAIVEGLSHFAGVPRRYEFRGSADGVTFVDDYAHLPGEVAATVATAVAGGYSRVICVFQPHRFTRTMAVAAQFAGAFDGADQVVVTPIYGAGEAPIAGVTGHLVAEAVRAGRAAGSVTYVESDRELADVVDAILEPGDLCLTMGAGDLTSLPDELLARRR